MARKSRFSKNKRFVAGLAVAIFAVLGLFSIREHVADAAASALDKPSIMTNDQARCLKRVVHSDNPIMGMRRCFTK